MKPFEIYPNSPLVEVVCEIRFPTELAIECKRSEFHSNVKDKYPKTFLPKEKWGEILLMAPYRFELKKFIVNELENADMEKLKMTAKLIRAILC